MMTCKYPQCAVNTVRCPNSKMLASGSCASIILWDAEKGEPLRGREGVDGNTNACNTTYGNSH